MALSQQIQEVLESCLQLILDEAMQSGICWKEEDQRSHHYYRYDREVLSTALSQILWKEVCQHHDDRY